MPDPWTNFLPHTAALLAGVAAGSVIAFLSNMRLQARLLKSQNKDKLMDELLQSTEEQRKLYANYWDNVPAEDDDRAPSTILQTRFSALLEVAETKYRLANMDAIKTQYKQFLLLTTGGEGFGAKNRSADKKRVQSINVAANQLCIRLWENKA